MYASVGGSLRVEAVKLVRGLGVIGDLCWVVRVMGSWVISGLVGVVGVSMLEGGYDNENDYMGITC